MKEVIAFAVVLFAVFQVLKTEPQVKEVVVNHTITQEKPVYVEKPVAVKESQIVEKTIAKIYVIRVADYRQPVSYYPTPRARVYPAIYETYNDTERRNYRGDRAGQRDTSATGYREPGEQKTSQAEIDYECSLKAPNFFGVESKCKEWRKEHGYD